MSLRNDNLRLTTSDRTFTLCEVSAMASVLGQQGIGFGAVLSACDMPPEALSDPASRISLDQYCRLHHAGVALCGDSTLLPKLARRLHLTSFGIVGFALLSSGNLGDLIRFAEDYSPLLNLKFTLRVTREGARARLCFIDRYTLDEVTRRACAVLELAKLAVLLKDVLGAEFRPQEAHCVGADEAQREELVHMLGCPVRSTDSATEIWLDASLLERRLPQSDATTHQACQEVCDNLMAQLANTFDLERQVRELIFRETSRPLTLQELASELCISQRTLRRRLDDLGTSYNQILEDVRKELAIGYLATADLTTEQIALNLGYSEAANFRHAFKRWTGNSPQQFKARQREPLSPARPHRAASNPARRTDRSAESLLLAEAVACWARPVRELAAEAA